MVLHTDNSDSDDDAAKTIAQPRVFSENSHAINLEKMT